MTDDFLVYLLFMLILLVLNVLGYTKMPGIAIFAIIGTIVLAVPTMTAFDDYWPMAIVLLVMNGTLPIFTLSKVRR